MDDKCVWCRGKGMDIRLDDNGNLVCVCDECPYPDDFFVINSSVEYE